MCGIAGVINLNTNTVSENLLKRFCSVLKHRGPDNSGYKVYDHVGFAHTRLSILDLSNQANQPFGDDNHILVYNGEIYNYLELKEQYLSDVQLKSSSDTEVLFHLLKRFSIQETLLMIHGMFAFAYYNKQDDKLFLARDRIGIKPLFYIRNKTSIAFSSEIKAFLEFTDLEPDESRVLLSTFGIADKSRDFTLFKNVKHVEPGTFLEIHGGEVKTSAYFNLDDLIDPYLYQDYQNMGNDNIVNVFEGELGRSVERMLMSDAPMGSFVSGGIDSSLISALASKYQSIDLFTANVHGKHSEVDDARNLSRQLNLKLFEFDFLPDDLISSISLCTYHMEVPLLVHTNAIPFSGVANLANQKGVKAVLTGEGSDELFLGYPRLLTRRFDKFIKLPFRFLNSIYKKIPGLSSYVLKENENNVFDAIEMLSQKYNRQLLRQNSIEKLLFIPENERLDTYLSFQMIREGILALLWRNDRMGMMSSIESRFPFLDENVLKFALNLPVKHKIGSISRFYNYKHPFTIDKKIVRMTGSNFLNDQLVYKRKKGFPIFGLRNLQVDKQFFFGGYIQNLLELNRNQLSYFVDNSDRYTISKFFCVELWAKIFIKKQNLDAIDRSVRNNCKLIIK